MKRLLLILQRVFSYAWQIPGDTKEFGFNAAVWLWWVNVLPSQKRQRYIAFMTKWMNKCFEPVTEAFRNNTYDADMHIPENHIQPKKMPIWVCWLQGEESMPELVKLCYRQLKKNAPDYTEIHLLTLANYSRYIIISDYIIEKFEQGIIQPAHFSDILRFNLLYEYGGMWIDSTVFTCKQIDKEFFDTSFWTQKAYNKVPYKNEPSKADWCGFLLGGKQHCILFAYMRTALEKYWKKHNKAIDYIMFDYMLLTGYNNIPEIKRLIDNVEYNNECIWKMSKIINNKFDKSLYDKLTDNTSFFKLSYKAELKKYTDEGEETFYKHMLDLSESE